MAHPNRIIIDTDPGVDDVLALLLALSAPAAELEVALISITFGNVEVRSCLRNAVAVFQILDRELEWRRQNGKAEGFEGMTKHRPVVAVGADTPLYEQLRMADYFHGRDGLAGIHQSHPHLSPEDAWQRLFEPSPPDTLPTPAVGDGELSSQKTSFKPSLAPAHKEILRVLRENEPDTVTIVAVGPLTNLALAAAEDTETFLRAKEVVTMGGAIGLSGNVTPVSEFNVFADSVAAARIYALTSLNPASSMPPHPIHVDRGSVLPPYPTPLSRPLRLVLFPVDLTKQHTLSRDLFTNMTTPLLQPSPSSPSPSPLASWMSAFMQPMFAKMEDLYHQRPEPHSSDTNANANTESTAFQLHDPVCIWYTLTRHRSADWTLSPQSPEDIRVETSGQWTRGMTVVDRRARRRRDSDGVRPHDHGDWLGRGSGNRVQRMVRGPDLGSGDEGFARYLLRSVLDGRVGCGV